MVFTVPFQDVLEQRFTDGVATFNSGALLNVVAGISVFDQEVLTDELAIFVDKPGSVSRMVFRNDALHNIGFDDPGNDDSVVYLAATQTLTNKTWQGGAVGPTFGGTGQTTWTEGDILFSDAEDSLAKLPIGSNGQFLTIVGGVPAWGAGGGGGGDDWATVLGNGRFTPGSGSANPNIIAGDLLEFGRNSNVLSVDAATALGQDSTVTIPDPGDAADTFALLDTTQTLTNKTIAAGSNTISGLTHGSEVDDPSSGVHGVTGNVVGTTDTQTLTNKTLTQPAIGNFTSAQHDHSNAINGGAVPFSSISGTVPVAQGGTNLTATPTNGQIPIGNGSGYTLATITPTTNQVIVTNDSGSVTLSLPQNIHSGASPSFAGLSLTGDIAMGSNQITGLADPTSANDAANKQYVDGLVNGDVWQDPVNGFQSAPPGVPVAGDRFIVEPTGTGDFAGQDNDIAIRDPTNSFWTFDTPIEGWIAWVEDENTKRTFNGSTWVLIGTTISHLNLQDIGSNSHAAIDTHIANALIHFTEGSIDHTAITNIGSNSHASIDTHIADATIHFTEASIDHTAITNIGTNSHAVIDTHIANALIHFTEGSIDHTAITNIGSNSHTAIDTHIADATLHFTEGSIDHTAITNIGTNSHAAIDTHIADATIHFNQSAITTVGIIATGTWQGTTIALDQGGTGSTTLTAAEVAQIENINAVTISNSQWGFLGAFNQGLTTGSAVSFSSLALTTALDETDGGTSFDTYATGDILFASAANTLAKLTAGSNTEVLTLAGGVPTWAAAGGNIVDTLAATLGAGALTGGTNIDVTSGDEIDFQATGTTTFITSNDAAGVSFGWSTTNDRFTFNQGAQFEDIVMVGEDTISASFMTNGMVLSLGSSNIEILDFKQNGVGHNSTRVESDTFGAFRPTASNSGGVDFSGFKDGGGTGDNAFRFTGFVQTTATTAKTAATRGVINMRVAQAAGSGSSLAAGSNIMNLENFGTVLGMWAVNDALTGMTQHFIAAANTDQEMIEVNNGSTGAVEGVIGWDDSASEFTFTRGVQVTETFNHDGSTFGIYGVTPAAQSSAYTRNATIVEDRTLLASASATIINNNNVLAALIADLQSRGFIG